MNKNYLAGKPVEIASTAPITARINSVKPMQPGEEIMHVFVSYETWDKAREDFVNGGKMIPVIIMNKRKSL